MFSAGASLGNERFKSENHFTDISRYLSLQLLLDKEEIETFDFDLRRIHWRETASIFAYGIAKFYKDQDVISPQAPIRQIIKQSNLHPIHDIRIATRYLKKSLT